MIFTFSAIFWKIALFYFGSETKILTENALFLFGIAAFSEGERKEIGGARFIENQILFASYIHIMNV